MGSEVLEMHEMLTDEHREEVNDLIQMLVLKQEQKEQKTSKRDLNQFIGCLTDEDAKIMLEAVEECRKIDYGEWYF